MRKYYSSSDMAFLRRYYPIKGADFCAKRLMRNRAAINQLAAKHNIRMIHSLVVRLRKEGQEEAFRKAYKIDINRFIDINMPEVAYFLGYFWADGHTCIRPKKGGFQYVFCLCIARDDYEDIKSKINCIGEWSVSINPPNLKTKRPGYSARIATHNKPLVMHMVSLDVHKKSWMAPTKLLGLIPSHLKHYFWRGYMDGDGSFRVNKSSNASFSGALNQDWNEHTAILTSLTIKYRVKRYPTKKGGSSAVIMSSIEDISKWGDYIYQGYSKDRMGLKRKYVRWKLAKEKHDRSRLIRSLRFDEPKNWLVSEKRILELIKRYDGIVSRKRILGHFAIKRWTFDCYIRKLLKGGKIASNTAIGDRPYRIL